MKALRVSILVSIICISPAADAEIIAGKIAPERGGTAIQTDVSEFPLTYTAGLAEPPLTATPSVPPTDSTKHQAKSLAHAKDSGSWHLLNIPTDMTDTGSVQWVSPRYAGLGFDTRPASERIKLIPASDLKTEPSYSWFLFGQDSDCSTDQYKSCFGLVYNYEQYAQSLCAEAAMMLNDGCLLRARFWANRIF